MMNEQRVKAFLYRVLKSVCDEWLSMSRERREAILYITGGVCSVVDTFYIGYFYITNRGRLYI